ncbi:MAG: PAS domain-containing protein, partial [Spirochaetaceae bacterium]|nr:PAS domain-containing protein [Spirochaetaceae bacterium]
MFDSRARSVFDLLPHLIGYTDSTLTCRYVNRAYESFIGKPASQLVGKRISEFWDKELIEEVAPYLREALGGARISFEKRLKNRSGRLFHTQIDLIPDQERGQTVGYLVVIQDLGSPETDKRHGGRSRDFLQSIIDACPVGLFVKDAEGRYTVVNKAFRLRYPPEREIIGKRFEEVADDAESREAHIEADRDILAGGTESTVIESRYPDYQDPAGRPRWSRSTKVPLRDETGRVTHLICAVEDIHDYKTANTRLDEAIREREGLIHELDHRVNNTLQIIQSIIALESQNLERCRGETCGAGQGNAAGRGETAEREGAGTTEASTCADLAAAALDALKSRVGALALVYSLLRETPESQELDAEHVLRSIAETCEILVDAESESGVTVPSSQLDAFVFIAVELLRNALPAGEIPRVAVRGLDDGGFELVVADNGPGLADPRVATEARTVGFALIDSFARGCGARLSYAYEAG